MGQTIGSGSGGQVVAAESLFYTDCHTDDWAGPSTYRTAPGGSITASQALQQWLCQDGPTGVVNSRFNSSVATPVAEVTSKTRSSVPDGLLDPGPTLELHFWCVTFLSPRDPPLPGCRILLSDGAN